MIKISYSSATKFKSCPQSYYHSKKYDTVLRPSAFAFGSALEEGVTILLQTRNLTDAFDVFQVYWEYEKGDTTQPIKDNPNIVYYKSDMEPNLIIGFDDTEEYLKELNKSLKNKLTIEEAIEKGLSEYDRDNSDPTLRLFTNRCFWLSLREKAFIMLESLVNSELPKIKKIVSIAGKPGNQFPIELKNDAGDMLTGFIDYVVELEGHKRPVILDCKTASSPYTEHNLITSGQLKTYSAALWEQYDLDTDVGYLVLGKKIKKEKTCSSCGAANSNARKKCEQCKSELTTRLFCDIQLMTTRFSDRELEEELHEYENVLTAIAKEVNYKNVGACTAYNRNCEYYELCWKNKDVSEVPTLKLKERK